LLASEALALKIVCWTIERRDAGEWTASKMDLNARYFGRGHRRPRLDFKPIDERRAVTEGGVPDQADQQDRHESDQEFHDGRHVRLLLWSPTWLSDKVPVF